MLSNGLQVADLLCSKGELPFFDEALASNKGPLTPARSPDLWLILSESSFLWVELDRCIPAVNSIDVYVATKKKKKTVATQGF